MLRRHQLLEKLGIQTAVFQAPMAGGPSTPAMAAATINAGGLGGIAVAGISDPEVLHSSLQSIRSQLNDGSSLSGEGKFPVQINFFSPNRYQSHGADNEECARAGPRLDQSHVAKATDLFYKDERLSHWSTLHGGSGVPQHPSLASADVAYRKSCTSYETMLEAALSVNPVALSFVFGPPTSKEVALARSQGIVLMGTATSVAEATHLVSSGIDCVIAQGFEAGGHRSTFYAPESVTEAAEQVAAPLSTVELVARVRKELPEVPIVAAGGIWDCATTHSALAAGADAVQVGTALLMSPESGCSAAYKHALQSWGATGTRNTTFTRAFSGRWARGLDNKVISDAQKAEAAESILPFPIQNDLTAPLRKAANGTSKDSGDAALLNAAEYLSLWAGTNVQHSTTTYPGQVSTAEVVTTLAAAVQEFQAKIE